MECQPKGGMCRACEHWNYDCSNLDFESMPIMEIGLDEIIVKCTEFERKSMKENK